MNSFLFAFFMTVAHRYKGWVCAVLSTLLIVWLMLFPASMVLAQNQQCPLHSDVLVEVKTANEADLSNETVSFAEIVLTNQNQYFMPEVRVAIALFDSADQTTPLYWRSDSDTYLLPPAGEVVVPLQSSLSMVPPGDYLLKAFAFQGNEVDLLGAVIRDAKKSAGIPFKKTGVQEIEVSLTVSVDGEVVERQKTLPLGHTPALQVETMDRSSRPIQNATLVSIVGQGMVPMGGAVIAKAIDKTTLLPQFARINEFSTQPYGLTGSGMVISTLMDGVGFTPIETVSLMVENGDAGVSWPYLSRIGFSQYPFMAGSEVVSCVAYTEQGQQLGYIPELLQASLTIDVQGAEVFSRSVYSDEVPSGNFFSFTPNGVSGTFDMQLSLSQHRLSSTPAPEMSIEQKEARMRNELTVIDDKRFEVACEKEGCDPVETLPTDEEDMGAANSTNYSFWFYGGIVIVAALLMYLMLRRLSPETKGNDIVKSSTISPDELQ